MSLWWVGDLVSAKVCKFEIQVGIQNTVFWFDVPKVGTNMHTHKRCLVHNAYSQTTLKQNNNSILPIEVQSKHLGVNIHVHDMLKQNALNFIATGKTFTHTATDCFDHYNKCSLIMCAIDTKCIL